MNIRLLPVLGSALCLPLFSSFEFGAERVRFAPAEGLALKKSISLVNEMVLDDMRMLMNGEPPPMAMDMEMAGTTTATIEVTDRYVKTAEGRPAKLARTYDTLSTDSTMDMTVPMAGEQKVEASGSSELTGKTVHFTWNAEVGGFEATFPEEESADEELLKDLAEDMDLRGLLPEGDVSVDEEWDVSPAYVMELIGPGGDLKIKADDPELEQMSMGSMGGDLRKMLGDVDGAFKAKFKGFREEGEVKLAVITFSLDVESSADLTEMVREQVSKQEIPGGEMNVQSADAEMTLKGEGELLFNAAAGHFHSLSLTLESTQIVDTAMEMSIQGQEMKLEQGMDFSATLTLEATAVAQ
jgi:hypothetical protein